MSEADEKILRALELLAEKSDQLQAILLFDAERKNRNIWRVIVAMIVASLIAIPSGAYAYVATDQRVDKLGYKFCNWMEYVSANPNTTQDTRNFATVLYDDLKCGRRLDE